MPRASTNPPRSSSPPTDSISAFAQSLQSQFRGKKVLFLSHAHPDLDTLASAHVLTHLFSSIASTTFGIPEKPLLKFQLLLESYQFKPQLISTLSGFDFVVCVDFRSPSQAGELEYALKQFPGKLIILDHHSPAAQDFPRVHDALILSQQVATSQIVAEMASAMQANLSPADATLLASGIVLDSYHFSSANPETFRVMHALLQISKEPYEKIIQKAFPSTSLAERLTTIRSLHDPQLVSAGDYLLAIAYAPYSSAVASNTLVQLGADVGVGLFRSREFITASVRVSNRAHALLGMDAMQILLPLAKENGGNCGGHPRAAQITLPGYATEELFVDACKRALFASAQKLDRSVQLKTYVTK